MSREVYTGKEWIKKGIELFGTDDKTKWIFLCPSCKRSIVGQEWVDAKAEGMFAFSCIGRTKEKCKEFLGNDKKSNKNGCNYAGGGLFGLNPVTVNFSEGDKSDCFAFDLGKRVEKK